jgi:phenylacetaldoxime dehydratase/aldoxime dehydratase
MTLPLALDAATAPHRPEGHQPVAPAWTALPTAPMVLAQLAVQSAPGDPAGVAAFDELTALLDGVRHDVVEERDHAGLRNRIALAYWDDLDAYEAWAAQPGVRALWEDADPAAMGAIGRWRELATVAPERIETLHSSGELGPTQGSAQLSQIAPTDVHEYPGGMRDRMAVSREDPLDGVPLPPARAIDSRGRRIVVDAPRNVCFIRTAQDWSGCGPAERARYLDHVEPTLRRGADYLAGSPEESGCISARFAREPGQDHSCVLAWFASLADLERWTHTHPTHQAILNEFFGLVEQGGGQIELALWHEVFTLPTGTSRLEYLNCHPQTGFVPYAPEERS